jgi:inner membrane protein
VTAFRFPRSLTRSPSAQLTERLASSPLILATTVLLFVAAAIAWSAELVGGSTFTSGVIDEAAHVLTTLLILWALGRRACERFLVPALIASLAIDLDHIPGRLGSDWLSAGAPRPYTHSLLTVLVALGAAVVWRRRRDVLLGVAIGLAIHIWRDLSDVAAGAWLLWPVSHHATRLPVAGYFAVMAATLAVIAWRSLPRRAEGARGATARPATAPMRRSRHDLQR